MYTVRRSGVIIRVVKRQTESFFCFSFVIVSTKKNSKIKREKEKKTSRKGILKNQKF
jgi:hypothetical protein